jgi:hypothetical protein
MTYTVTWSRSAQNDLAELWTESADRALIAETADAIDAILKRDPYRFSESRSGNSRVMLMPPLAVAFDVSEDDRLVSVWSVWRW